MDLVEFYDTLISKLGNAFGFVSFVPNILYGLLIFTCGYLVIKAFREFL